MSASRSGHVVAMECRRISGKGPARTTDAEASAAAAATASVRPAPATSFTTAAHGAVDDGAAAAGLGGDGETGGTRRSGVGCSGSRGDGASRAPAGLVDDARVATFTTGAAVSDVAGRGDVRAVPVAVGPGRGVVALGAATGAAFFVVAAPDTMSA